VRHLLDACSLIWYVDQPHQLSAPAHAAITAGTNDLYLSSATVWEISIKAGLGKLKLSAPFRPWIEKAISDLSLILLPITVEVADDQSRLPRHHGDPFDRILVATCLADTLSVVSADVIFDAYGVTRVW
jgi:PIN domain nuclease of toxin-antitoxin system